MFFYVNIYTFFVFIIILKLSIIGFLIKNNNILFNKINKSFILKTSILKLYYFLDIKISYGCYRF